MSQQGERRTKDEDAWWSRLYDDEPTPDTGPAQPDDTLDTRFDSAANTLSPPPPPSLGVVEEQRQEPAAGEHPPLPARPASAPDPPPWWAAGQAPAPAKKRPPTAASEPPLPSAPPLGPPVPPSPEPPLPPPSGPPRTSPEARPPEPPEPRHQDSPLASERGSPPGAPESGQPDPAEPQLPESRLPSEPGPGRPASPEPRQPGRAEAGPSDRVEPPSQASPEPAPRSPTPPAPARPPAPPVIAPQRAPWEPPAVPQVPPARRESVPPPSRGDAPPEDRRPGPPAPSHRMPEARTPRDATAPPEPWQRPTRPELPQPEPEPARPQAAPQLDPRPAPPPGRTPSTSPYAEGSDRTPGAGSGGGPLEGQARSPRAGFVGDRPPTYDAEPSALPAADPRELGALVADTVLDGARYGTYTLRAASIRGDSARYRGEPRRDALLTARFGRAEDALVLVAVAGGARAAENAHLAAADACRWIGEAVGRSHARLADDIRAGRRGDLKSGLHRLTDRSYGKLRARASELGLEPEEYTASLRCLLLPADPACRTRVFFGIGGGGLFRLRGGAWQDIEPPVPEPAAVTGAPVVGFGSVPSETAEGDRLTMDLGITTPPSPYVESVPPPTEPFRFRASVARPGDTLLLCSGGLADPLRGEPALAKELAERWAPAEPPGLAEYLADTGLRVKGYADDRTAVAVWEA
ncbi:protein phosphatase 2C domain-containing protein [Streptomyces sp. ISL-100]|uniref:protein phosphatase 2C domain-containing protein n=1 Tax=Streptomyces sp. ISL-100 TaxID=2819173 RepID=UPI001BE7F11A|nr:protein phosphatase 2C domain-containing protein [Streptomyces sp. ISL-100]MBT2399489.1 protein phosphatase 2C domain-containing protein [Streptomyces sp. ISL-100]